MIFGIKKIDPIQCIFGYCYKNIPQWLEIGFVVQSHIYTYTYIIVLYMYVYILIVLKDKQTNILIFLYLWDYFWPVWPNLSQFDDSR